MLKSHKLHRIEEISNANLGSIELIKDPLDDPKLPLNLSSQGPY